MHSAAPHLPPRNAAVEILCLWATTRSTVDVLFQSTVERVADIDRGLVKTLVFGVLRQKEYLDGILRRFSKHPLRKMKVRTLMTLRIGIFQLLFLQRIPDAAAVNTTINTLKDAEQPPWLIGFVNGVLRNVARNKKNLPTPEQAAEANPPVLNHPAWLVERWRNEFGETKMRAICACNNVEPPLTLRANRLRGSRRELLELFEKSAVKAAPGFFSPQAVIVEQYPGPVSGLPGYAEGRFQVQDEAAQLASLLIGPLPAGARVLDGCAGLGGKTSHLVEMLPAGGMVVAVEPESRRYGLLRENLLRLGQRGAVIAVRSDLQSFAATRPDPFDAVFIDAPCSGTGVIRRQPDIRWNRQPADFKEYQKTQLQLLTVAASLLKPGGVLVYATCSLEPEENLEVVRLFCERFPGFVLETATPWLPEHARRLVDAEGCFRPNPADGLDGFFAARLVGPGRL